MRHWPVFAILPLLLVHVPIEGQTNSTPIAPVILFVHGICAGPEDWQKAELLVAQSLHARFPDRYPDVSTYPPKSYAVYYNPLWFEQQGGHDVLFQEIYPIPATAGSGQADPSTRFFRVAFIPDNYDTADFRLFAHDAVAQLSMINNAAELAHIIAAIRKQTNTRPLILVTHSMGGLVARAMLEDVDEVYSPILDAQGDIKLLLQVDTPNLGITYTGLDTILSHIPFFDHCIGTNNYNELLGGSETIAGKINSAQSIRRYPADVPLRSLVDVANPRPMFGRYIPPDDLYWLVQSLTGGLERNDGIVPQKSQDIRYVPGMANSGESVLISLNVVSLLTRCGSFSPLHLLGCLADQSLVMKALSYLVEGPAGESTARIGIVGPRNRLIVNTAFPIQARIDGLTSTAVDWMIAESSGASIDSAGVFLATAPGVYHVTANTHDPFCVLENCNITLRDTLAVSVVSSSRPGFTLYAAPQAQPVAQGQTASFTLTAQSQGGFTATVTPVAWGLPKGGLITWSPPNMTLLPDGSATSTLTIGTSAATVPGNYRIRLRANAPGVPTQEVVVFVRVSKPTFASIWPMSGHDPQRTGLSQFAGPNNSPGPPIWTYVTSAPVIGDISVSAEGIIYFASDQLYALNPDGTWYAPPVPVGGMENSPAIDDNSGYVYIPVLAPPGFDLLRFTKQLTGRTIVAHIPLAPFDRGTSAPIIGSDGTVYVQSGGFPAGVTSVGAFNWRATICPGELGSYGTRNAPALDLSGGVFAMCEGHIYLPGGGLYKLDKTTGATLAYYPYSRGASELMIDQNQFIHAGFQAFGGVSYVGSYDRWDGNLNHISGNWMDYTTGRASLFSDGSSTVRPGYSYGFNNSIVAEGAHSWEVDADGSTLPDFSTVPSVDAVGTVYVGTTTGVAAYRGDGTPVWSYATGDTITTQPVISNNGALYVGSASGKVYAFQGGSGNQGIVSTPAKSTHNQPVAPLVQPTRRRPALPSHQSQPSDR